MRLSFCAGAWRKLWDEVVDGYACDDDRAGGACKCEAGARKACICDAKAGGACTLDGRKGGCMCNEGDKASCDDELGDCSLECLKLVKPCKCDSLTGEVSRLVGFPE